jgi:hypothetical protein
LPKGGAQVANAVRSENLPMTIDRSGTIST